MVKKIIMLLVFFVFIPLTAFSDCNEDCYTSTCDIPGTCEMECENNICYYYDNEGNCWKYDKDRGYYPCGCACYKCNDSCFDHDHCDCGCDDDDCCWDDDCEDYCCFIGIVN